MIIRVVIQPDDMDSKEKFELSRATYADAVVNMGDAKFTKLLADDIAAAIMREMEWRRK